MRPIFIIIAFYFLSGSVFAQSDNKDVTITASGSGKTLEDAKQSALRSATEQAFGAFISSKTEMFNDQVVADQMASVSSGNIKSYEVLSQDQSLSGKWFVTLKAILSVNKLISFAQAKGVSVEIKGGIFATNIKQQLINEQSEINILTDMTGVLHEVMQTSFDYSIKSGDPRSLDNESKNWEIPVVVTATTNNNIEFCVNYILNTLKAVGLNSIEVDSYKLLNKTIYPISISYNGRKYIFSLRKKISFYALNTFFKNWPFYISLFNVQFGSISKKGDIQLQSYELANNPIWENDLLVSFDFPKIGQKYATISWKETFLLSEIEKITNFTVKPRGVISYFRNGGYLIYEENGHGLVLSTFDLSEKYNLPDGKLAASSMKIAGYSDWKIPSYMEFQKISRLLFQKGMGGFLQEINSNNEGYWSSDGVKFYFRNYDYWTQESDCVSCSSYNIRLVRKY